MTEREAVNHLQESPSTSLTGVPEKIYREAKHRVATWNPIPPAKDEDARSR